MKQDLNVLLLQVEKGLKKRMFPRKHVKLLSNKVTIEVGDLDKDMVGRYDTIENEKDKDRFTHKITINKRTYDDWQNGFNDSGKYKKYMKQRLKNVIADELIHAYVYERYEFCLSDCYIHADGSPIFLSILAFLNIPSGHAAMCGFKYTELYKKVMKFTSFDILERYLLRLTVKYTREFNKVSEIHHNGNIYMNSFIFSGGDVNGLKGISTSTYLFNDVIGKVSLFSIGANVDLNNLEALVMSKTYKNIFEKKKLLPYCTSTEYTKARLKLQSMNI